MSTSERAHVVRGVDHAAFPTFDPRATIRFYRDVLGFPVVHATCALGWGPGDHPDFIHFFFDIGNGDRLAFFYYFGVQPYRDTEIPELIHRARHLAIHVDSEEHLQEYRRRLDASDWPCELQVRHETVESIYVTDPNGHLMEITRPLRAITVEDDIDANVSVDALMDVAGEDEPTLEKFFARKAKLIAERYAGEAELVTFA
ncbi:MAG: VOC family protein [Pseudonocardia sp.]|uniref:VOC family protein n=1 Tax=unclassified Pseudonocardia TaxID=2619320 RepID=UPI0008690B48|nr:MULTISPECIES: VOC family protein [unclassified Pseudonocardia]MBN9111605.1 VOC family protein [Pseudonocardia sp.]ODU26488.1 MAG: glyoxalase [Pseudonocardia sp. SCN 72-51]ODU98181.1 MAG: glyoxalase [Pseudonocardia sp. SCN 73-27]